MLTATETGLSTQKLEEISELVKRAGQEAVQLRIVERFLSEVERRLLKTTPVIFDIERIKTALHILKTLTEADEIDECLEAEFRLDQEFHLWRTLILERDQKIEAYHFRRLCDSTSYPLDDQIFVALVWFYCGLDFTPASQSKFDLSVTRLFTRTRPDSQRELRGRREENVDRLREIISRSQSLAHSQDEITIAVTAIEDFVNEALQLRNFEDLVRAKLFDRYRDFKRDLGDIFFEPEIVAVALECNVVLGNRFDDLLRSADEQLSSRLTVDVDLAEALHDPAPESRSHVAELFRVFFGDDHGEHNEIDHDIDYLGKLLSVSSAAAPKNEPAVVPQADPSSAQGRIAPLLRTLTTAKPDAESLKNYMARSENLKTVDLEDFLYSSSGAPDILGRRALGLVLWSYEFRETDLKQSRDATESIKREATTLLYKAENLATELQKEIDCADAPNENRLRAVLNALLDSRLKLERGIVRFTNRKSATPVHATPSVIAAKTRPAQTKKHSKGRDILLWITIILIAASLTAGTFFWYQQDFKPFW